MNRHAVSFKFKKPIKFVSISLAVLAGWMATATAEDITVTTYYPSPRGVYQELRANDRIKIGNVDEPFGFGLAVSQDGRPARILLRSYGRKDAFFFDRANGSATSPTDVAPNDLLGIIRFRGFNGGSDPDAPDDFGYGQAAAIRAFVDDPVDGAGNPIPVSADDVPGRLTFYTHEPQTGPGGMTERLRIDSRGNVGIGTRAPLSRLQVEAPDSGLPAGFASIMPGYSTVSVLTDSAQDADDGAFLGLGGARDAAGADKIVFGAIAGKKENNTAGDSQGYLALYTGSRGFGAMPERMRIDSQGRVGIGTSSPQDAFHLVANPVFGLRDMLYTVAGDDAGVDHPRLRLQRARGTIAAPLAVQNDDDLAAIRFDGWDGNEYLGAARVEVEVDGPVRPGDVPTRMAFHTTEGAAGMMERMRITGQGRVGIGTATPAHMLDVNDDIGSSGDRMYLPGVDGLSFFWFMGGPDEIGVAPVVNPDGDNIIGWKNTGAIAGRQIYLQGDTFIGYPRAGLDNFTLTVYKNLTVKGDASVEGALAVTGKINANGGIDPPFISFSDESHESIRAYAKTLEPHEKVMQFWHGAAHRMEVYVVEEDRFYTLTGEPVAETN